MREEYYKKVVCSILYRKYNNKEIKVTTNIINQFQQEAATIFFN
jgi:hypothetical protein